MQETHPIWSQLVFFETVVVIISNPFHWKNIFDMKRSPYTCALCILRDPLLVPPVWYTSCENGDDENRYCMTCFCKEYPRLAVISFDGRRYPLRSKWRAEGLPDEGILEDPATGILYVLAEVLDAHHTRLMEAPPDELLPEEMQALLVAYRQSPDAMCHVGTRAFYQEMWGWFSLPRKK
jgi:hypothetical protein